MRLTQFTITRKLAVMSAVNMLLTIVLAIAAYQALILLEGAWQGFRAGSLEKIDRVSEGRAHLGATVQSFKNYVLRGKDYDKRFLADLAQVERAAADYRAAGDLGERERAALDSIAVGVQTYRGAIGKAVEMKAAGASIEEIDKSIAGADKSLKKAFEELSAATRSQTGAATAEVSALVAKTEGIILAASLFAVIIGAVLARLLSRSITRPLHNAVRLAQTVAAGDLTSSIDASSGDETGQLAAALKEMNESLLRIIGEVRSGADLISTASQQIASGNLDLSSRTEEQASSLEETASSMEELTVNVQQNAAHARKANQLASAAAEAAGRGGAVVAQVVDTMGSITESAQKIVDIIAVIDGIALQTNILALNAAVESARAGEQGRGFAVVAAEVRSLAQRSASAAKEVKELIGDSVQKVEAGSVLVGQAGATMSEIVTSVAQVNVIMADIMAAGEQQSMSIEEINKAVVLIDQVGQQNAALVEEAAAAADSLQNQAGKLAQAVSIFKLAAPHAGATAAAGSRLDQDAYRASRLLLKP